MKRSCFGKEHLHEAMEAKNITDGTINI